MVASTIPVYYECVQCHEMTPATDAQVPRDKSWKPYPGGFNHKCKKFRAQPRGGAKLSPCQMVVRSEDLPAQTKMSDQDMGLLATEVAKRRAKKKTTKKTTGKKGDGDA